MPATGGISGGSGLSGLTKKQSEMSRAYSPAANQALNLSDTPPQGVVDKASQAEASKASSGQENRAAGQRTAQSGAGIGQVAGLQENLGIFNQKLLAQVNTLLSGQGASNLNTSLAKGGTPVLDPATGKWTAPDAEIALNLGDILGEKKAQQSNLRDTAGELFQDGKAKSFEEVLKKFGDKNGDGVIDAAEQQWINEAFDIVNSIRRLKTSDPNSAEHEALLMQLSAKDKNGLASGLIGALEQYEKIVGMKATGADADAYYLRDLLNMNEDTIRSELEKATTQSSGLFGADYQAYAKREADKSAQQYTEAGREDATVMQTVKETSQKWLQDFEKEFEGGRTQLNSMFKGASDTLIKDLDAAMKADPTNKGIAQAKDWFVDTQTLVQTGSKDFGTVIFQALTDSRLGAEPKKVLKKWLGQTIGEDAAEKGVLANLIDKIGNTGYFWTEDGAGNQVKVVFDAQQKMDIVRMMNDPNLTTADKTAQIQKIIEGNSKGMAGNLQTDLGKVLDPIRSGNLEKGLNKWEGAMAASMKGFDKSLVQTGYEAAVSSLGRGIDAGAMQAAIQEKAKGKLDEINAAYEAAKQAILQKQQQVAADTAKLQQNVELAGTLNGKGINNVLVNWTNAMKQYSNTAMERVPVALEDGSKKDMSRLETAWVNAKSAANPPEIPPILRDPRTGALMYPNVTIPADISSEKYAKPYAALTMLRNLRDNKSPIYTKIMSDYLGGMPTNVIDAAMATPGSIFASGNRSLEIGAKVAQALSDRGLAQNVWETSPNNAAVAAKIEQNRSALAAANAKVNEINTALSKLDGTMQQAQATLQNQIAAANAAAQAQAAQAQAAAPRYPQSTAMDIYPTQAPQIDPRMTPQFVEAERAMQQAQTNMNMGGGDRTANEQAYIQARQNFQNTVSQLNSGAAWGTPLPQTIAMGPQGGAAAMAPVDRRLSADISRETANNMFNQALDGQVMNFTDMPQVDLGALRDLGNIQYVNQNAGDNPAGLANYVGEKWSPAENEVMTARPYKDVKPITPFDFKPATLEVAKPAPVAPEVREPVETNPRDTRPTVTSKKSDSPIVSSSEGSTNNGSYTINKHEDGSITGTWEDGSKMDQTAIDESGAQFGGPLQPINHTTTPVKTTGQTVQDIASTLTKGVIPNSGADTKIADQEAYSDGKVAGQLDKVDVIRAAKDPVYKAGVELGQKIRADMIAVGKQPDQAPQDRQAQVPEYLKQPGPAAPQAPQAPAKVYDQPTLESIFGGGDGAQKNRGSEGGGGASSSKEAEKDRQRRADKVSA